jgi:hypothetical protein
MATTPNPIQQDAPQTTAPAQDDSTQPDSILSDENAVEGESANLQRGYSKLNCAIAELFDGLGVRRSATIPHIAGENLAQHLDAISNVLPTIGGVTANLLTATHTKHDQNGGATIAHPAPKLREAIIPKNSEAAKAAIAAERSFISKCAFLLGDDDSAVKIAKSQIDLIGKSDLAGMTAFDAGVGLLSIPGPLIQKVAQMHDQTKEGGMHPKLRAPKV